MDNSLEKLIRYLRSEGWAVTEFVTPTHDQSHNVEIPAPYLTFTSRVKSCVSGDTEMWFNCLSEYNEETENAFAWDGWKKLSLSVATSEAEAITRFWAAHVPIINSVKNGLYAYFALNRTDGSVWCGTEPLFEEAIQIALSFDEFSMLIVENRLNPFYQQLFDAESAV